MYKTLFNKHWPLCAAIALCIPFATTSCSDDEEETVTNERHWTTDGGLRATDNILFDNNTLGNGDEEIVFNGKQLQAAMPTRVMSTSRPTAPFLPTLPACSSFGATTRPLPPNCCSRTRTA